MKRDVKDFPYPASFLWRSSFVVALIRTVSYSSSSSISIKSGPPEREAGGGAAGISFAFLGGAGDILKADLGGDLRLPGGGCGLNAEGCGDAGIEKVVVIVVAVVVVVREGEEAVTL
jgi:hypothetical protein